MMVEGLEMDLCGWLDSVWLISPPFLAHHHLFCLEIKMRKQELALFNPVLATKPQVACFFLKLL
jgi:hypothetical protein